MRVASALSGDAASAVGSVAMTRAVVNLYFASCLRSCHAISAHLMNTQRKSVI